MRLLEKLDRRNSRWATRKIASERRLPPDISDPVVSTSYGLFSVRVVDLEAEGIPSAWDFLPLPVALLIALLVRPFTKTEKSRTFRYEARVVSLGFPVESRVVGTPCVTCAEAQTLQRRYQEQLRDGWNPRDRFHTTRKANETFPLILTMSSPPLDQVLPADVHYANVASEVYKDLRTT